MAKVLEEIAVSKLTDSQKMNVEIVKNILSINTALSDIKHIVDEDHRILIIGNGEIPIRETVRTHDIFIREIRYWIKFIFGVVVTQSIGLVLTGVFLILRLLPLLERIP